MTEQLNRIEELNREEIMDHYTNPRNFGELEDADIKYYDYNPVCGDEVKIQVKLSIRNGARLVESAKFKGRGCAISQAAASMLTESIIGKELIFLKSLGNEHMLQLLAINPDPVRIKCALLPLKALQKGVLIYEASDVAAKNGAKV